MTNPFFDVSQVELKTSSGYAKFPIFYYETSVFMAFFWADFAGTEKALSGTPFKPLKFFNGKALSGIAWYEYRHTDIGSYNEVGLAVATYAPGEKPPLLYLPQFMKSSAHRKLGFYILDLPVTTDIANAAGTEIWGFPKFVTEIELDFGEKTFKGVIADPDKKGNGMVTLSGSFGGGLISPAMDLVLYSTLDDEILRTVVNIKADFKAYLRNNLELKVNESGHRMAENIAGLGIKNKKPFLVQVSHVFNSRLNLGEKMGAVT